MPSLIRLDNGQIFELKGSKTIGRGSEANILVDNEGVSRLHATIELVDGEVELKDLDSRNGLYVNSRLIKNVFLKPGDRIGLGSCNLVFSEDNFSGASGVKAATNTQRFDPAQRNSKRKHKTIVMLQEASLDFVEYTTKEPILNAVSRELEGEWLKKIFMASLKINSSISEMDTYEALNEVLQDRFDCDQIYLALFDADRELNLALTCGNHDPQRLSLDILKRVMVKGHSILCKSPLTSGLSDRDKLIEHRVNSIIAVPLMDSANKPFGTVYIDCLGDKELSNDEFGFTRAICYQTGLHLSSLMKQPKGINETQQISLAIPGVSSYVQELNQHIRRLSNSDAAVLLAGSPGSDYDLMSRAIHASGIRGHIRLLRVNVAQMDEDKHHDEVFFGNPRSGYPGKLRQAAQGSLLIENIDAMPRDLQKKMADFIIDGKIIDEEGNFEKVDTRLIFTLTQPVEQCLSSGKICTDLLKILQPNTLLLQPLNSHREDLKDLCNFYFGRSCIESSNKQLHLTPEAMQVLSEANWSGDEQELLFALKIAILRSKTHEITADELVGILSPS